MTALQSGLWFPLQAAAEAELKEKGSLAEASVKAAERRLSQVEQQNKLVHEELERMAAQLPTKGKVLAFGNTNLKYGKKQLQQIHKAVQPCSICGSPVT